MQDHLDRLGVSARVEVGSHPGHYVIDRDLDAAVAVSVIIPTRGTSGLVWGLRRAFVVEAVRSLLARTGHQNLEIVVVHDASTPEAVLDELRELAGDRLVPVVYDEPFNFSRR